ncbi:MAG: ribosomal protein, partial [Dehalococcoidia bacterium]|nr:ribosomal protein [Dehalococcoidia bacterium]
MTKTYTPKGGELRRNWRVIDAAGRPLGRLASEVAQILRGKDKPTYTPNMDTGDFVIVVNAAKVVVTGAKTREKMYYTHSTYPGGFKQTAFDKMLAQHPRRIVEWAVWGMLPKGPLGRDLFRKLKVYAEGSHPHGAQAKEMAAPVEMGKPGRPKTQSKKAVAAAITTPATAQIPEVSAKQPAIRTASPRRRARAA